MTKPAQTFLPTAKECIESPTTGRYTAADLFAMTLNRQPGVLTSLPTIWQWLESETKSHVALSTKPEAPTCSPTDEIDDLIYLINQPELNLAAGHRAFKRNVRNSLSYMRLLDMALYDFADVTAKVYNRLRQMCEAPYDPNYEHPNDTPIAFLLIFLHDVGVDEALLEPFTDLPNGSWTQLALHNTPPDTMSFSSP